MVPGDARIFSLLPFKVEEIKIHAPAVVDRGEVLNVTFEVETDKSCSTISGVMAISFYNPSGEYEWIYCDNEVYNGNSITKQYKIPFNEKTGRWSIKVKDAATGVTANKDFVVE
jgi:hypothetical protein